VSAELVKYSEAIDVVTSMLEIDFASAVSFLEPFKDNAVKVSNIFESLSQGANNKSDMRSRTIKEDVSGINTTFLIITILAGLLVAAISWLIGRMTSRSIENIAHATESLANGDRSVDVESLAREDELGKVVTALAQFREQIIENDRLQEEREEMRVKAGEEERRRAEEERESEERQRIEDDNRRAQAETERKEAMQLLANSFDESVNSVMSVVLMSAEQLDGSASGVQERASGNNDLCFNLSTVAGDVSSGMQTVATATEELSSSIGEIARQMQESSRAITETVAQTDETNRTVQDLASSAEKIGTVVNLINDIASQTNLLALNATIEAARAGDAGKGFAVVASEVKGLASQTGRATEEIAAQVEEMQTSTLSVVKAMESIGARIQTINDIASAVSSAVEEQTSATSEIAHTVSSANDKVGTLAQNSEELTMSAKDNGAAAQELLEIVATLKTEFRQLENETSGFVSKIRST
jgi:methyl-accepting chemotaxis protein